MVYGPDAPLAGHDPGDENDVPCGDCECHPGSLAAAHCAVTEAQDTAKETSTPVEAGGEVDFSDLTQSEQISILATGISALGDRLSIIEGSLVRILMRAGEIEGDPSAVVVPKMTIPRGNRKSRRRR